MRTVTEFLGFQLKTLAAKQQELAAAGKTADELNAALTEATKLEGEKLQLALAAVQVAQRKMSNLKRVIVLALNEGEKAPSGAVQAPAAPAAEGAEAGPASPNYFLIEELPAAFSKAPPKGRDDDRRGGKRGDRKGKRGGRGGKGGERSAGGRDGEKAGGDRPRGPRPPRGPKPAATPKAE